MADSSRRGGPPLRMDMAAETPVPESGSVSPTKRGGDRQDAPAKRVAVTDSGSGLPNSGVLQVDMQMLARLLEETGNKIMQAQHEHLEARMGALEDLTGKRLAAAETRVGTVETKVDSLEGKIEELTKRLETTGGSGGTDQERRMTLVYGGWPRDSRRADILKQLQKALEKLGVWQDVDADPFTTGPRRATALSVFKARKGEGAYDVRQRMHGIIRALADNEIILAGGKKLFATFAKSKAERDIASHAAWIKRTIHGLAPQAVQRLDIEYATGGVWAGHSFVASAKQPPPPGVAGGDLLWDETKGGKHWIHVSALARELGLSEAAIRDGLEEAHNCGVAENNYARTISDFVEGISGDALIVVQEVARQEAGWQTQHHDTWQALLHRDADAWRGVGLIFRPSSWSVMRRKTTERGAWFRVRHATGTELWVGTAHFTPGTSQAVHASQVANHLQGLPATQLPVLRGCDVNSQLSWSSGEYGEGLPTAKNGKTFEFLSQCKGRGLDLVPPSEEDFETPASCPRQDLRAGKQIDAILQGRARVETLSIHKGSHKALGTDHELLSVVVHLRGGRAGRPHRTNPRIWTGGLESIEGPLDHKELMRLAQQHTRRRPGRAYSDPPEVKEAFKQARVLKSGRAWTRARKLRKSARLEWETDRLARATSGDWAAYRQLKRKGNDGWDIVFAEAHEGKDPHQVVHDHLAGIYTTGQIVPPLGPWDGPIDPFTMEELEFALSKGKKGKAVGVDQTSQELLSGIASVPGGKEALLKFYNQVYRDAVVPAEWNTALMVVIPKELLPVDPKNLRPLAMGRAMGDGATFRSWHALLAETDAVLQTGWDQSRLQLDRGIKQGSIESPALFSYLAEQILEDTKAEFRWADRPRVFEGLDLEELLFMDDGCVWADSPEALGCKLEEWSRVLLRSGLALNPAKCKVYFSPFAPRNKEVEVFGKVIASLPTFTIMGVPFRVGASASELLAPFVQRAKDKFWAMVYDMARTMVDTCRASSLPCETKRDSRRWDFPPSSAIEQTASVGDCKMPLRGGNLPGPHSLDADDTFGLKEYRAEDEQQVEVTSLMQTGAGEALEGPWLELLEEIRLRLEGYGKGERSQVAGHMLRLLDHRATDAASGYLLGHMPGRVSTLTALLVAMRDEECYGHKVPAGDVKLQWLRQTWDSVTKYIPQHPGSAAAAGRWPSHDMPVIMTFMRPLPEDTPPSSPIQVENSSEQVLRGQQKRRYAQVELSSGSADHPRSVRLEVPLHERTGVLQLRFTVEAELEPNSPASTVPAEGAPGGLDTYGLSASDFEDLRWKWNRGEATLESVSAEHGAHVAGELLLRWGSSGVLFSPEEEPAAATVVDDPGPTPEVADGRPHDQEEDDISGLFAWWSMVVLHQQAVPQVALTSALMELIWRRGDQDYLMETEGYIEDLGLTMEVDRDRATELPGDILGAVEWMEAELWQIFVDELEGAVGETHQVQSARGQATMTPQQCQGWWQWAELVVQHRSRSRSRSPRAREQEGDGSSLMETGRSKPTPKRKAGPARGDRRDQDEDDDRGDRRAAWPRNGLSDGRRRSPDRRRSRKPARGASSGARERTPVPRVTSEVRRLGPRGGACRPPAPMTVGNATCFWLHTLGLRDGLATDDHHALDPEQHSNRVRAVQDIRQEDVLMLMVALMRTMAMFVVESSQLMMSRVGPRGARGDEEVEVEVEDNGDDEEMWMQTSRGVLRARGPEEGEQLAEDERDAKQQKREDRNSEDYQLQERAREEEAQERADEALWQQHVAATYRDWEWWVVQTCPPSRPRRLQASMMIAQGSAGERVTCSIPLARGRPIDIRLSLREVQEDQQAEDLGSGLATGSGMEENLESRTMALYRAWMGGHVDQAGVQAIVGDEMMGMFWAQRMVEEDGDGSQCNVPGGPTTQQGVAPERSVVAQGTTSGLQSVPHGDLAGVVVQGSMVEQGVMRLPVEDVTADRTVEEENDGAQQFTPGVSSALHVRDGLRGCRQTDVTERVPEHVE
ncbi:pol [Symbiodinium necroappetens]|uniref:Pol protein n=1 Tax=Symbiodinium necroappetens TaxID=1628268 RepID=A0A812P2K0_9DINO|nr:pol [Symbiodinium necroappetens]